MKWILFLLILFTGQPGFSAKPFDPGERVVFLGDSITHYGKWWSYIWCGYAAQFPDNPPLFFNAGFSGDTAAGGLTRLERDVFPGNPSTVCVMFGMNDARRRAYTDENNTSDQAAQKAALEAYRESMDQLLMRVADKGLRCIVVTPSPYDQTMVNPEAQKVHPGYNDGLAAAAQIATELARKYNFDVVDFHGAMTRINTAKQESDPASTIISLDRIHPGDEGSRVMAELFLKAQGIDLSALEYPERFPGIWEHVSVERHLRNIVWLEDKVLKPNHIDPADVDAAKTFLNGKYRPQGADHLRIASYSEWKGKENELCRKLEEIEKRLVR